MEVSFAHDEQQGVPVLSVGGEIDVYTAPRLREHLLELALGGTNRAVVDLTDVTFVDSTGLGVLVSGLKRFREAGGDLVLVVVQPQILKVFEITGLSDVFRIHSSTGEAVAS
ncbi:MAG TPA: STAS domain-containing protein [Acidimicrobiales bacterium]|nr:STAS domain-containing protein [Acidimicrobiales bacterium]